MVVSLLVRSMASDYHFGIFKLFLQPYIVQWKYFQEKFFSDCFFIDIRLMKEMATSTGIIEEAIYKILPQLVMNELKAGFTSSQRYWRNYMIKCASGARVHIFYTSTFLLILSMFVSNADKQPHRWCNGNRSHHECGRSRVWAPPGSNKVYTIDMCCFAPKHVILMSRNKDWLAHNQMNVSE